MRISNYKSELSFRNKIARLVWGWVWLLLFRPSPRICFGWRAWLLRRFGARIGRHVRIYNSARIYAPWNLVMEDHTILGDFVDCYCVAPIHIKGNTVISQYSYLCSATHDFEISAFSLVAQPIAIGPDAWVAADAFIGPGVTVGRGAVVGARASVFKNVEPWTVVGGNPAKMIRRRTPASN